MPILTKFNYVLRNGIRFSGIFLRNVEITLWDYIICFVQTDPQQNIIFFSLSCVALSVSCYVCSDRIAQSQDHHNNPKKDQTSIKEMN